MKVEYIEKPFAPYKIVVETKEDQHLVESAIERAIWEDCRMHSLHRSSWGDKLNAFFKMIKNPT